MKKKALSLLLTLAMLLSLVPAFGVSAAALDAVSYLYPEYNVATGTDYEQASSGIKKWHTGSCTSYTCVSSSDTTWGMESTTTWYVATGEVTIDHTVTVLGDVHLILADGCALTVNVSTDDQAGICVSGTGNSLTIYAQSTGTAMGELTANGGACAAGIGGGYGADGENITINGGTVTATGGSLYYWGYCDGGAGIGGGYNGDGKSITINGGTVIAQGGYYAAGVGGGYNPGGGTKGNGESITINGGTVTATGGNGEYGGGAGIGGGIDGIGRNISITGGTVTATCGSKNDDTFPDGAAIGNGHTNKEISASNITVSAGLTVKAGNDTPPTAVIAHTDAQDLASTFANKHYVTIVPPICVIDTNGNGAPDEGETKYPTIAAALEATHNDEDGTHPTEIVMIADDTENVTIPAGRNITLDLNGFVLKADLSGGYDSSVITNNGTLTIKDSDADAATHKVRYFTDEKCPHGVTIGETCSVNGSICKDNGNKAVADGSYETYSTVKPDGVDGVDYLTVTGGCITGANVGHGHSGMGVYNTENAVLTFLSGNIVGNAAVNGGGIRNDGDFTIAGGNIVGNWAEIGGGVYNNDSFNMMAGTINHNRGGRSGGVENDVYALMTMTGGMITDNSAEEDGGVGTYEGNIILGGTAKIYGNTARLEQTADTMCRSDLIINSEYHPITLGTSANGTDGNKVLKPADGMKIGVSLVTDAGTRMNVSEPVAFTTSGTADDTQYFFSDFDSYYVKLADNKVSMASRITQQPTADNNYEVSVDKSGISGTVSYQWILYEKTSLEDESVVIDTAHSVYTAAPDGVYQSVNVDPHEIIIAFDNSTLGATMATFVSENISALGVQYTPCSTVSAEEHRYSVPIKELFGFNCILIMDLSAFTISDVQLISGIPASGQTSNRLTTETQGAEYCCRVTFPDSTYADSDAVIFTGFRQHSSYVSTITVPISGDKDTVKVQATVSGTNATINNVTNEEIKQVGTGDTVVVNLSGLNKSVTGVTIPKTTFENVAASDAAGLEVKLPNGTIAVFDKTTLKAVASQAKGVNIQLVVDRDSKAEQSMTKAQKEVVSEMNKPVVLDAYFVSNGVRISDFKGGEADIIATYETVNPVRVWYVTDDGTKELVPSTFDGKEASFTVKHFSHYVIEMLDGSSYNTCPQDSTCVYAKFSDANPKEWYHSGVHFCVEYGYMNGIGNDKFAPNGTLSRAMIVTMLWRIEGSPVVNYAMTFKDVAPDFWYTEAIRWAQSTGVVLGYDETSFGPEDNVTREQLAAILWRYAKLKGYDVSVGEDTNILSYDDAIGGVSEYAIPAMQWACGAGIINGIDNRLEARGFATRAQAACMIQRFCVNVAK